MQQLCLKSGSCWVTKSSGQSKRRLVNQFGEKWTAAVNFNKTKEKKKNWQRRRKKLNWVRSISTGRGAHARRDDEMYAQEQIIDHKKPSRQLVYSGGERGKGDTPGETNTACDWSNESKQSGSRDGGGGAKRLWSSAALCIALPVRCGKSARRHPAARPAAAARKSSLSPSQSLSPSFIHSHWITEVTVRYKSFFSSAILELIRVCACVCVCVRVSVCRQCVDTIE